MTTWLRMTALLATTVTIAILLAPVPTSTAVADERTETPEAEFQGAVGYGISVAMSSDSSTAMVGQLGDSTFTDVPGTAHVLAFGGSTWTQQTELTGGDSNYDDLFGNAVAISADGDTAIVGDPGECGYGLENCEHGVAYVFVREGSTWTQQSELKGGHGFGGAVALSGDGDTALVGAGLSGYYGYSYGLRGNAPPTVFDRTGETWTQATTLTAADATGEFDNLGHSLALSADGHTALIGDPTQGEAGGAAYVFTGSGSIWIKQAKLTDGEAPAGTDFGASVAISADGDTALIGAPASDGGSAFVFEDGEFGWEQQSELTPNDAEVTSFDGWFGNAVALDAEGNIALVGAPWAEEDLGAAYEFARVQETGWGQQTEVVLEGATPYDYFGDAVALDGEGGSALIGRYDPGASFFRVPLPADLSHGPIGMRPTGTPGDGMSDSTTTPATVVVATGVSRGIAPIRVVGMSVSPGAFRAAPTGASTTVARGRYGAKVTYSLSAPATVRFTVAKLETGRLARSGRCDRAINTRTGAQRCTLRTLRPGGFTQAGHAGANRFRFAGRLAGHQLPPGSYELIATPTFSAPAPAATAPFRVKKP
jgi:hypothetical protein